MILKEFPIFLRQQDLPSALMCTDPTQKTETFLAGSFNHFNPGDSRYKLAILDSTHKSITLTSVRPGKYFFKFTRGNWGTVESAATGDEH